MAERGGLKVWLWLLVAAGAVTVVLSHLAVPVDVETLRLSLSPDRQLNTFADPRTPGHLLAACLIVWTLLHLLTWFRTAGRFDDAGPGATMAPLVVLAALCVLAFPFASGDAFLYAAHGATWLQLDANPYAVAPDLVPGHPLAGCGPWCGSPAFYGPLAIYVGAALQALAGTGWALLLLSRLVALGCLAGALAFAEAIRRRTVGASASDAWVLFAASPLLLVEAGVAAHNDAWVALLLLAGVFYWLRLRLEAALPLFAAAVAIKYTSLIFAPALLVFLWRAEDRPPDFARRLAVGLLLALGVSAALVLPFGVTILDGLAAAADQATRSPVWLLGLLLGDGLAGVLGRGLALVLAIVLALRVRSACDLPWVLCATYFGLLLVGTAWFQPWYLLPLLPLALASDRRWLSDASLVFAGSALVGLYGVYFLAYSWAPGVLLAMTVVSFGPVLIWLTWRRFGARRIPASG